jgi:hypothetical protein
LFSSHGSLPTSHESLRFPANALSVTGWQKIVTGDYLFHGRNATSLHPGRIGVGSQPRDRASREARNILTVYIGKIFFELSDLAGRIGSHDRPEWHEACSRCSLEDV